MKLYEHASSGNCLKCRLVLRALDLPYESARVDLFRGETRTDEHFARNPDGRIPVLETDDGELIPESGAILLHLAEGTPLLPAAGLDRARVHQWMFFEQNRIEADLAVARFLKLAGRDVTMPEVFGTGSSAAATRSPRSTAGLSDGPPPPPPPPPGPGGRRGGGGAAFLPARPSRWPTSRCTATATARRRRGRRRQVAVPRDFAPVRDGGLAREPTPPTPCREAPGRARVS